MLKFCELTGLTVAALSEIAGCAMAVIIVGVFLGNISSWFAAEFLDLVFEWLSCLGGLVRRYIEKKLHR